MTSNLRKCIYLWMCLWLYLPHTVRRDTFQYTNIQGTEVCTNCVEFWTPQFISCHTQIPHDHGFTLQTTNSSAIFPHNKTQCLCCSACSVCYLFWLPGSIMWIHQWSKWINCGYVPFVDVLYSGRTRCRTQ